MRDVSCHFRTGEKLKIDVLEKYVASRKIYSECDIQNQLCYALLDQKLHGLHPLNKSTTEVMQQIHSENHNLPFPAGTAWQHRFSHLVKHVFSFDELIICLIDFFKYCYRSGMGQDTIVICLQDL